MKNKIIPLGKSIALLSFMIGTLILIQFSIILDSEIVEAGFNFIEYAFYANCLVFIIVAFVMFWEKGNIWQFSKTLLWMLANIRSNNIHNYCNKISRHFSNYLQKWI